MDTFDKIIEVLEKADHEVTADAKARVRQLLECVKDENSFYSLVGVQQWLKEQRESCAMEVSEIGMNELEKWKANPVTGNIEHDSGEFFSVIGVKVSNTVNREVVGGWTQPMIKQKEGGIIGILCKNFNGVRHYLINAKGEPGNPEKLQLSPTLQATYSNLKRAHGGKKPKFAEYFEDVELNVDENGFNKERGVKVLYCRWQAEDGGRFYLKSNYNMLVEVDESTKIDVPSDYIWLTMYQLKQLLKENNLVGPHVRGIIAFL